MRRHPLVVLIVGSLLAVVSGLDVSPAGAEDGGPK
jgi:hypothetical protein